MQGRPCCYLFLVDAPVVVAMRGRTSLFVPALLSFVLLVCNVVPGVSRCESGVPFDLFLACSCGTGACVWLRGAVFRVMSRICLFVFAGAAGQTFPAGVAPLLSKLRSDFDGLAGAHGAVQSELASRAAAELANKVVHDKDAALLAESALRVATRDVLHFKYVGACRRDLRGCPSGWAVTSSGPCSPPDDYDGPCGDVDVSALTPLQKEEFAISCKAAWPCAPCITEFSSCPVGWSAVGRLCVAPGAYDGGCSPVADFVGMSPGDMASWSASCGARWPCARN